MKTTKIIKMSLVSICLYMFILLSIVFFTSGCEREKNINMPETDLPQNSTELVEIPIDSY